MTNRIDDVRAPRWQRRPDTRRAEILDGIVIAFGRSGYERARKLLQPGSPLAVHVTLPDGTVSWPAS